MEWVREPLQPSAVVWLHSKQLLAHTEAQVAVKGAGDVKIAHTYCRVGLVHR